MNSFERQCPTMFSLFWLSEFSSSLSQSLSESALHSFDAALSYSSNSLSLLGVNCGFASNLWFVQLLQSRSRTKVLLIVVTLLLLHLPQKSLLHELHVCFKHTIEKVESHVLQFFMSDASAKLTFRGVVGLKYTFDSPKILKLRTTVGDISELTEALITQIDQGNCLGVLG